MPDAGHAGWGERRRARVQFVSKPVVPPFRDGSKCLVRDLCLHLDPEFEPHVLGSGTGALELGERTQSHAVYGRADTHAPALANNARAFAWLLATRRADLWHFVFAPNPRTSSALRLLCRLKQVPSVQTIASPPRSFERPLGLLFGDRIVAQSRWTKQRFEEALAASGVPEHERPRLTVIPPPAPVLVRPDAARVAAVRRSLELPETGPLFLYPGDLEVSRGAAFTLELAHASAQALPDAHFLLAYRHKTERTVVSLEALRRSAPERRAHFRAEVPDLLALLEASTAVVFPVDDLYGKVDLPIVLLEALSLGVPVLALSEGPLSELEGAQRLPADPKVWLEALAALGQEPDFAAHLKAAGPAAVAAHYAAPRIAAQYQALYRELLLDQG